MDFFPTILELAGLAPRPELHMDGASLVPRLKGQQTGGDRTLVWHYPHYHGSTWTPGAAIREGDWKLIEFYEFGEVELYDLGSDPGELHDQSLADPGRTAELRRKLRDWQAEMGAAMPRPRG